MRVDLLLNVLPIMGYGMLGIFLVTGILIGCVAALNRFFAPNSLVTS